MSRYALNIHQVHIADGFTNDCDELIHKCLQLKTLTYPAFCDIWKDLHFGMIYQGRSSGAEIAELSEEVIHIGKQYMVKDTVNFEESVAGLFLVYGLLTLQPYRGFVWLRIIPDDVTMINRIQVVARQDRRLDVLYILGEVLIKHSHYHIAERDRGMEPSMRKYLQGYTSIDKYGVRPRGIFYRQNEELDLIRDLSSLTKQYVRAKTSLIGVPDQSNKSLQYIDDNLPTDLNTTLRRVINGIIDDGEDGDTDDDDDDNNDTPSDHYEAVQAIKDKAMTTSVNSMKHLVRIEDRQSTSPKKKIDLKGANSKIKANSPRKPINRPRKRKSKSKPKKETQVNETLADTIDINLDEFNKGKAGEEQKATVIEAEKEEPSVEIEFIDQTESKTDAVELSPLSKKKRKDGMEFLKVVDEPEIKKVKYQPDMKRTKLKSKFKRMGMLSVANFNEQK